MDDIIIYDLEYTTWDGSLRRNWSKENEIREITWIAAIRVDVNTLQELDSFECIVKPILSPVLSEYFINLTGLPQQRVDTEGISFYEGLNTFLDFVDSRPMVCHGWDILTLLENFQLKNLTYQARRIDDNLPIVLNLAKGRKLLNLESKVSEKSLVINTYSQDNKIERSNVNKVVCEVDLGHPGQFTSPRKFKSFNIRDWLNANAPETIGKFSGDIGLLFGQPPSAGNAHEPLFDVRSILHSAKHLINNNGADNFFKSILSQDDPTHR